jgi:ATP-binding cassette subfamily C (CFTR/MRP) protein 10
VRGAFVSTVYAKVLRLGPRGAAAYAQGTIVDLMSTDTDRVVNFCQSFHQVSWLPNQTKQGRPRPL